MHNRNFSASAITQRRMEKAMAGSFFSATTREACPRVKDSSFLSSVRSGQMTQYSAYTGGCVGISPGCPCSELNQSVVSGGFVPAVPGAVSGIVYTVGSLIVSWNPPREGTGPFRYVITLYKKGANGSELVETVETAMTTSYRFTTVEEGAMYHATVCAKNDFGLGPVIAAEKNMVAPPSVLSVILNGGSAGTTDSCIAYLLDAGLEEVFSWCTSQGLGPTRGSRLLYLWVSSMARAWNWVTADSYLTGVVDGWDWSGAKCSRGPLGASDQVVWMCQVMDVVTPAVLSGYSYRSMFPVADAVRSRVQWEGQWSAWESQWRAWWTGRSTDGSAGEAGTAQPTESANWGQTLVVDGVTVNPISSYPSPSSWTALAVQSRRQGYLTYRWGDVRSTCLSSGVEEAIVAGLAPPVGAERDAEVDAVLAMSAELDDVQKCGAEFWAGGSGTVSPPLMLAWLWREYGRRHGGGESLSCAVRVYSLLDLAVHLMETARVVWRVKRAIFQARPIQEIRRRYVGQAVASWNGLVDGSQWVPYQTANVVTPPFADFPSGHSAFSRSFALVMEKWFGPTIQKGVVTYRSLSFLSPLFAGREEGAEGVYGDFVIPAGASEVQHGIVPALPVTLSFSSWSQMADAAGMSRLYGGIHALSAHQGSQTLAVRLHQSMEAGWGISTVALVASAPAPAPSPSPSPAPSPAPAPAPAPSEPEPSPSPAPQPEPIPAPEPSPSPAPQPEPVPSPAPSAPAYSMEIRYVSQIPSATIQTLLQESTQWIQRLMLHSHGVRMASVSLDHDMVVDVDIQPLSAGILAGARPTVWNTTVTPAMPVRQSVTLNANELVAGGSLLMPCMLNGQYMVKLIPVMIHEMLHGLGIASLPSTADTVGWGSFLDASRTWYVGHQGNATGSKAIQAYQAWTGSMELHRIPVENSFGQGTAYSHWEEGMRDGFVSETRTYDEGKGLGMMVYPALPNELMTGVAGSIFYLTPLTLGALADYGYPVKDDSDAVVMYPK